jgi:hypothetical protein
MRTSQLEVIHDISRNFETLLRANERPSLERIVAECSPDIRGQLVGSLIPIELSHNLCHGDSDSHRRLEPYLGIFPWLLDSENSRLLSSLIVAEFRVRQELGDRPAISSVLQRFSVPVSDLEQRLRESLYELEPTIVIFAYDDLEFVIPLDQIVEFGRQPTSTSPSVGSVLASDDRKSVIIAPARRLTVSRKHATFEFFAMGQVAVTRHSRNSVVVINSRIEVEFGATVAVQPPCFVNLGPQAVRLQS